MKHGILTVFLLLFAAAAAAQEADGGLYDPHDIRIVLPYQTEQTISFHQPGFKPFSANSKCLRFIESIISCEYDLIPSNCTLQLGVNPEKSTVTTRLKLFNRQIFLTFSVSD